MTAATAEGTTGISGIPQALGRLTARSSLLTSQERQRLERAHHTRLGLQVHEALLLQQVRRGTMRVGWTRTMSNKERVAAGSLFKAGLVEVAGDQIALTEYARFSLETKPSRKKRPKRWVTDSHRPRGSSTPIPHNAAEGRGAAKAGPRARERVPRLGTDQ
jgi:hypothetical protein